MDTPLLANNMQWFLFCRCQVGLFPYEIIGLQPVILVQIMCKSNKKKESPPLFLPTDPRHFTLVWTPDGLEFDA